MKKVCRAGSFLTLLVMGISSHTLLSRPNVALSANVYDKTELTRAIDYYADLLGFDSTTYILVRYSMELPDHVDGTMKYREIGSYGHQVLITINGKNSRLNKLLAVAHELIHVKQYIDKQLEQIDANTFRWHKDELIDTREVEYTMRPWEYQALRYSKRLRHAYLRHLRDMRTFPE